MTYNKLKVIWKSSDGSLIACKEKIKVLEENLQEFQQEAQDILEDALLIGCDEKQIKEVLHATIAELTDPYKKTP